MIKLMKNVLKIFIFFLISVPVTAREDAPPGDSVPADTVLVDTVETVRAKVDSVLFVPRLDYDPDKHVGNPVDFEQHLTQNPTAALFKSMLVPGLGQIGNRRYLKAALFIGLETWFIVSAVHYGIQAHDYRQAYDEAAPDDLIARRYNYILYEDRRDNRNKFTWFAGITVFISMFDAYVDAHLSGSPYRESKKDLSFDVRPDIKGGAVAVISYSF